jgi:hypothetical protein
MKKYFGWALILFIIQANYSPMNAQDSLMIRNRNVAGKYNKVLAEALVLQLKADSLARIARDRRILARDTPDDELKNQLGNEIIQSDIEAKYIQCEADKKFSEARNLKTGEKDKVLEADSRIELSKEINGIRVYQYKNDMSVQAPDDARALAVTETPAALKSENNATAAADEFAFLEKSPYNESNPIPRGLEVHPGLIYRIQLGVFSKIKSDDAFGGISPVAYEQVAGSNALKYYAGLFHSINAVTRALDLVRLNGFQDAFIVAFLDGKSISTEKAKEIEFEKFKL